MDINPQQVLVIFPALNEEKTIVATLESFFSVAPSFRYMLVDNGSSDRTVPLAVAVAQENGINLEVIHVPMRGKANAIRIAFRVADADYVVMCDADLTYPALRIHDLIKAMVTSNAQMAVGDRHGDGSYSQENSRKFHEMGNLLVKWVINTLYNSNLNDVLSGYRVFTREFVKSYPLTVSGFELETDLTLHALDKKMPIVELPISYIERPTGSISKLNTYKDGIQVLKTIFRVFRYYKPMKFFGFFAAITLLLSILSGLPPILDYLHTGFVKHIPLAILAGCLMIVTILLYITGLILDSIADQNRRSFEFQLLK